jgi:type II secretory pathway pseudopilin PulG
MQKTAETSMSKRGISIIETVIALMIFSICIGGFCGVVMQARQLSDQARAQYTAVNMAKNRFERARSFDFDQLHLFHESQVVVDHDGQPSANGNYRRTTTVSNVNNRLKEMTVNIEIKNRISTEFRPGENLRMYFADYVELQE